MSVATAPAPPRPVPSLPPAKAFAPPARLGPAFPRFDAMGRPVPASPRRAPLTPPQPFTPTLPRHGRVPYTSAVIVNHRIVFPNP